MSPLRFVLRLIYTILLLWVMTLYLPQYVRVEGGSAAYLVIGTVLTVLNMIVRPLLNAISFPLKLFATLLALILVNTVFLWIAESTLALLATPNVTLVVADGLMSYIMAALLIGFGNWLIKEIL